MESFSSPPRNENNRLDPDAIKEGFLYDIRDIA